jgi:hypothetical protein
MSIKRGKTEQTMLKNCQIVNFLLEHRVWSIIEVVILHCGGMLKLCGSVNGHVAQLNSAVAPAFNQVSA